MKFHLCLMVLAACCAASGTFLLQCNASPAGNPPLRPAGSGTRDFTVLVDGKPAGTCRLTAQTAPDGTETITSTVNVKVGLGLLSVAYTHQSTEVWNGRRLVSANSFTNDDGKKYTLRAMGDRTGGLSVTVNDKSRRLRSDVLTSTAFREPDLAEKTREMVLLDLDDGTETAVRVERLAPAKVAIKGGTTPTRGIRLAGKDVDTVCWYDAEGKLVRQEMKWDGHRVVLELVGIKP